MKKFPCKTNLRNKTHKDCVGKVQGKEGIYIYLESGIIFSLKEIQISLTEQFRSCYLKHGLHRGTGTDYVIHKQN